jgi:flagellar P-ring protein precursor FlgI
MKQRGTVLLICLALAGVAAAQTAVKVLVRDIATVEGIRDNALIGYGLVVGLNGTGDRRQTMFTTQTLASVLQRMGVQVAPGAIRVNNVAAVFVTASLPPFARSGTKLDVTVSSVGDAKSIEGGMLLLTSLRGPDGDVYAMAQGPVALGGYSAGGGGNSRQVNHPTVGRVPEGALVERNAPNRIDTSGKLTLLLAEADFPMAEGVAAAINADLGAAVASVTDARRVELAMERVPAQNVPALLTRVEMLPVTIRPRAKVVVNERTGTVVMGKDVKLGAVSILHGTLAIDISTQFGVSQPSSLSGGETMAMAQPSVKSEESKARRIELNEGATVEELVTGLQAIGATTRDIISILQALKAEGALQAQLEIL